MQKYMLTDPFGVMLCHISTNLCHLIFVAQIGFSSLECCTSQFSLLLLKLINMIN